MKTILLDDFLLDEFDFNNDNHLKLEKNLINSTNSDLISKDIDRFIKKNHELGLRDNITIHM